MKAYNKGNYEQHKLDIKLAQDTIDEESIEKMCRSKDKIVINYMPLVENIARRFNLSYRATGIMCIQDLIQEGYIGLMAAAENVDCEKIMLSTNPERMLVAFLSIRIKGAIRRAIDDKSRMIRFSERQIAKIRDGRHDEEVIELFFNSVFSSIHHSSFEQGEHHSIYVDIDGNKKSYGITFMTQYINGIIDKYLSKDDATILDWTYGLNGDCLSYREISKRLGLTQYEQLNNKYIQDLCGNAIRKLSKVIDKNLIISFFNEE